MAINWSYMNLDIKAEIQKLRDDLENVLDALERAVDYKFILSLYDDSIGYEAKKLKQEKK